MKLEISEKQAEVLQRALDLYSRLGCGQVEAVIGSLNHLLLSKQRCSPEMEYWELKQYTDQLKAIAFGLPPNAAYGIFDATKVSRETQISYDLLKVIQLAIAKKQNHSKTSVWWDGPNPSAGPEPLATVIDDNGEKPTDLEAWVNWNEAVGPQEEK